MEEKSSALPQLDHRSLFLVGELIRPIDWGGYVRSFKYEIMAECHDPHDPHVVSECELFE